MNFADKSEFGGASIVSPRVLDSERVDVLHEQTFVASKFGFAVAPTRVPSLQRRGSVGPAPRRGTGALAASAQPVKCRGPGGSRAH